MRRLNAILSIHDVAPATITRVEKIIKALPESAQNKLILLVIPGLDWNGKQLDQLRAWQEKGYILAGHGWIHKTTQIKSFYHRLHSLFVSRDVAEHLSLSSKEIIDLMQKNFEWFATNQLGEPDCYVPPAWALGKITSIELRQTPFEVIETTRGYMRLADSQICNLPLVGYEADTLLRKMTLTVWNKINETVSSQSKPLRISIHPFDTDYLLAETMHNCLARVDKFVSYHDLYSD